MMYEAFRFILFENILFAFLSRFSSEDMGPQYFKEAINLHISLDGQTLKRVF